MQTIYTLFGHRADFADFTELCYKEFGDRVKHWITINEPWTYASQGYDVGTLAPGRCSAWRNNDCPAGDSATEPYKVAHHLLLCHGAAVKIYKEKYQVCIIYKVLILSVIPDFLTVRTSFFFDRISMI